MSTKLHIARSIAALLLWTVNLFALPAAQPDLLSAPAGTAPKAITFIDYAGCNGTPIAVTQKSKAAEEKSPAPNFIIDADEQGAAQNTYYSRSARCAAAFYSLASLLIYTETTTSRL